MSSASKLQLAMIAAAVLILGWQFRQHLMQSRDLASVEAQVRVTDQALGADGDALKSLEQRNRLLVEAERRAGNATLISLMRERAAARKSGSDDTGPRGVGTALASLVENPEQRALDRKQIRDQVKAGAIVFARLVKLSPAKEDEYVDLNTDIECRKAARIAALLRGTISLDDALSARDAENAESQNQLREIIGDDGCAFYQSIADGMRNDEAKRLLGLIQQNMSGDELNSDQSDRLQGLIKAEIAANHMDDTDLFRSPDDWVQQVSQHQQNVLNAAAGFLSPAQLDTLKTIAAADLTQKQQEMLLQRSAMGIK
jgi:hypothetical protein